MPVLLLTRLRQIDLNALLLRLTGLVALLSIPIKHLPRHIDTLLPFNPDSVSHVVTFLLGIVLLYIANQIARKKRSALVVAVCSLLALVGVEMLYFRNPLQLALYAATLTSMLKDRQTFVVRSDLVSLRRGLLTASGIFMSVLVFFVLTFTVVDQRGFGRHLTTGETIAFTSRALVDAPLPSHVHLRRNDLFLIKMLRTAGAISTLIVVASLFQPLRIRRPAPPGHRGAAEKILQAQSTSSEDFFALWPADKHYYFYQDSFIAYKVVGGVALVLGGARGKPPDAAALRPEFLIFARQNGWDVAIVDANETEVHQWQKHGLKKLYIGSEAIVHVPTFVAETMRNKHFRYVQNKAAKEGLQAEVWRAPLGDTQLDNLARVSQQWLARSGHREYTFAMGYFDREYLRKCEVVVLTQNTQVVAYANLIPSFAPHAASIDHMRSVANLPSVAMHYLLMETIALTAKTGGRTFNLGLAPLSHLEQHAGTFNEYLLGALKRLGGRYYSFGGLTQFKNKFVPQWEPKYIAHQPGPARLVQVSRSLNAALAFRSRRNAQPDWPLLLSAVAALAYVSFPLAFFLNRPLFAHGLASELGSTGQPFNWVFNGLDVASGIIASALFLYLLLRRPQPSWLLRTALVSAIAASVGAVLAAVIPLPAGFNDAHISWAAVTNAQVFAHGASSFINSFGFLVSLVAWGAFHFRQTRVQWRTVLVLVSLLLVSLGFVAGQIFPATSGLLQRAFLVCYAVWLVLVAKDYRKLF